MANINADLSWANTPMAIPAMQNRRSSHRHGPGKNRVNGCGTFATSAILSIGRARRPVPIADRRSVPKPNETRMLLPAPLPHGLCFGVTNIPQAQKAEAGARPRDSAPRGGEAG